MTKLEWRPSRYYFSDDERREFRADIHNGRPETTPYDLRKFIKFLCELRDSVPEKTDLKILLATDGYDDGDSPTLEIFAIQYEAQEDFEARQAALAQKAKEESARKAREREKAERTTYERLKAKFEGA